MEIVDRKQLELLKRSLKPILAGIQDCVAVSVDGYLVPHSYALLHQPTPFLETGHLDKQSLASLISSQGNLENNHKATTRIESRITAIFAKILSCSPSEIPPSQSFLLLGGDSPRAGKLLSALRSEFSTHIPIELVFQNGSVSNISANLRAALSNSSNSSTTVVHPSSQAKPISQPTISPNLKPHSSTNPLLLQIQLLPLSLLYPLRRSAQWTIFLLTLAYIKSWPTVKSTPGRLLNIVLSALLARTVISIMSPFIEIAGKWLIIGRYKEGVYPMWGGYHTRWWIVQRLVSICGMGVFNMTNRSSVWYYHLSGARIGRNVELNGTKLGGEWDLVDIGDRVVLAGRVHIRPFAVERETLMYLGRIMIGRNSSIGPASFLAPGMSIPEGAHLGPNSSSWEVGEASVTDPLTSPYKAERPHWMLEVFGTVPILLLAKGVWAIRWLLGILGMVMSHPLDTLTPVISIIQWFSGTQRVLFHFLAVSLGVVFSPVFLFVVALGWKGVFDLVLGKAVGGEAKSFSRAEKLRVCLIKDIFPESTLHELTSLFGQHYEMASRIMRLLGARVGKRVYWPGTGPNTGDYHLIDVVDDVVFGSRANFVTSDGIGSEKIVVKDRAMVFDRVTLLLGATVGENTVLGSGALTRRGKTYVDGGVYIGSKGGDTVCLSSGNVPISPQSDVSDLDAGVVGKMANSVSTSVKPHITSLGKSQFQPTVWPSRSSPRYTGTSLS